MDTIAVATDFSVRSDRALLRAKLIAQQTGAKLVMVHVVDDEQPPRLIESTRNAATAVLAEFAQTLRVESFAAESLVVVGDIASGILNAADQVEADLIIVGPHRRRFSDIFAGTTVERLVRSSKRPLLVAVEAPSAPYARTLLAIDLDEPSKAAAQAAVSLGIFDHTHVTIMHAFDAPAEGLMRRAGMDRDSIDDYRADLHGPAAEQLRDHLDELGLSRSSTRVIAINGTPARTILESARREGCDLVMLGTSQRKGLERLLIGSVTSDVIRDTRRDILIVPVP